MKHIRRLAITVLCLMLLTTAVFAESSASSIDNQTIVDAAGNCTVTMMVRFTLDGMAQNLTFPLPAKARDVRINGTSARTGRSAQDENVMLVDLSHLVGFAGEQSVLFSYSMPDVVHSVDHKLTLELPVLEGFDYPVKYMKIIVSFPTTVTTEPAFYSGYLQQSVESKMVITTKDNMVTAEVREELQDHETLRMVMEATPEMFPGVMVIQREGNPELIPMGILAGLALLYWLLMLRTAPLLPRRRVTPLEGVSAGELGSCLTMAGADLTGMVFSWARFGYLLIHLDDNGRVMLHKRMDMGNERTAFEVRVFNSLFGRRRVVDGTGYQYAMLCRKVARSVPRAHEMLRRSSGNVKIFRFLGCGIGGFCGVMLAMNMFTVMSLQILMAIVLAAAGVWMSYKIQAGMYRLHLRGKTDLWVSLGCSLLWVLLGLFAGQIVAALVTVLGQLLIGLAAAYGGRRSDLGRLTASEILGLRQYYRKVTPQELAELQRYHPSFLFENLPCALALGVERQFGARFGKLRQPECSYFVVGHGGTHTAQDWARLMRDAAEILDTRQRRMTLDRWNPFHR